MKKSKLLALALVSTLALSVGLISTHSTKVYADSLSDVPGYTQHENATLPKTTELPISLYRSNNISSNFYIYNIPGVQRVEYGTSGQGRPLYYYKIGNGPNTLFANFAIHGFEDSWAQDGYQLTKIAHQLIEKFNSQNKEGKLGDWSVIIVPCANPDGVLDGWTNNGPGRAQISEHIDLNRDFPTYFKPEYNPRNYTGPHPLGAPEAKALANLVPKISRESRNMVLLDVHGWLDMTIGDPQIGRYFINNLGLSRNVGYKPAGHGYFISYGHAEGAEVSLVELPDTTSPSQITSRNYVGKMYNAMNQVMRDGTGFSYIDKTGVVINTSKLNIRSGATTDGNILGHLKGGESVHILGSINGWYKIYQPSLGYAYVSSDYIKITGNGGSTTPLTGWQNINGNVYYYNKHGVMQTGWHDINGKTYFFNDQGIMQTGWIKAWGSSYYFAHDGAMFTGWHEINGKTYKFDEHGVMQTGWVHQWGSTYYFGGDGVMLTGWHEINGKTYKFDNHGIMQTGWVEEWGSSYYFSGDGSMLTGWHEINGKTYKFDEHGVMKTGWIKEWGSSYYFGHDGVMLTGWQEINGKTYKFDEHGVMQTGWVYQWGATYYFGGDGVMLTGLNVIDGKTYMFNEHGIMQSN